MMYNGIRGKLQERGLTSIMQQMFVISDCLCKLGYIKLASEAQRASNWEFAHDYVSFIVREAQQRQDDDVLDRLASACLIYG